MNTNVDAKETKSDPAIFVMDRDQQLNIARYSDEISDLIGFIHSQIVNSDTLPPLTYIINNENDTSFFYETKSFRIEKDGNWIIAANNGSDLNTSFNYYCFEKVFRCEFSRIKEKEAFSFAINENLISVKHFNVKDNKYVFNKYMGDKSYELLCLELKSCEETLMLILNRQIPNLIII
jgi:hypothetical protein